MPYKFRIVFGGLCALVPGEGFLDVLMVNTENDKIAHLNHKPEPHHALLEYSLSDLSGGGPKRHAQWPLVFEDVTVNTKTSTQFELRQSRYSLDDVPDGASDLRRTNPGEGRDDLAWISDLRRVCPVVGKLEPDCLASRPSVDRQKGYVKSRMRVDKGVVRALEVAHYNGKDVLVEYLPKVAGASAKRAAIPHLAAVEMEVDSDSSVEFSIKRFDKDEADSVSFGPPVSGTETITVHVTNLCCGGYKNQIQGELPSEDSDFECFYILFKNFDPDLKKFPRLPIPVPVDYEVDQGPPLVVGGGSSTVKCSMTRIGRE